MLHQHLLANGLCDFEVNNKSRQEQLNLHLKKVESKYKSMPFFNMFIPYKVSTNIVEYFSYINMFKMFLLVIYV